jgi:hypothetical protein
MVGAKMKLHVDPFGEDFISKEPQKQEKVKPVLDKAVMINYLVYCATMNEKDFVKNTSKHLEVLSPAQISMCFERIKEHGKVKRYSGIFLSKLIRDSYNNNHNGFHLDVGDCRNIDSLCDHLIGKEDNPLKVTVNGDTGGAFGFRSENCIYHIYGDTDNLFGAHSISCEYYIEGDVHGPNPGAGAKNCKFHIKGNCKANNLGVDATDSEYFVEGDPGICPGTTSKNCKFIVTSQEAYDKVKQYVRFGNEVELFNT